MCRIAEKIYDGTIKITIRFPNVSDVLKDRTVHYNNNNNDVTIIVLTETASRADRVADNDAGTRIVKGRALPR